MAQEIQEIGGGEGFDGIRTRTRPFKSDRQEDNPPSVAEGPAFQSLRLSGAILSALGDESSRKILTSAIPSGKTVEEISAEQNLPLSTCYRRVRNLLGGGLMILERTVVTPAGKRYAVYRTSFSKASISFDGGKVAVELTPNMDIIDKLRRKWLSENYPLRNQDDWVYKRATAP